MITLQSDRLRVEIEEPGSRYRRSRFDWTGFIRQIWLDETHTFCTTESLDGSGSGGEGLCNEFGIFEPVGYDDCERMEQFPKIGVGLLTRPDHKPYCFWREYDVEPFDVVTQCDQRSVVFEVLPHPCRGYSAWLSKAITLDANNLIIDYVLHNIGDHPIKTHEYCHNFLSFNNKRPGPEYSLEFSGPVDHGKISEDAPISIDGNVVNWLSDVQTASLQLLSQNHSVENEKRNSSGAECSWWQINYRPDQLSVRETLDSNWTRLALWQAPHVVSPEAFVAIDVALGQSQRWRRSFQFEDLKCRANGNREALLFAK